MDTKKPNLNRQPSTDRSDDLNEFQTLVEGVVPLYHQIESLFEERINSGRWRENHLLPSEEELSRLFHVSRGTVRLALTNLARKGLISRKRGRGTIVAPAKVLQEIPNIYRFALAIEKEGRVPKTRILESRTVRPSPDVRHMLRLGSPDDRVILLKELRLADDEPLMLEDIYLPEKMFPGLTDHDLERQLLYDVIIQKYGVRLTKAEETLESTVADRFEARVLRVKKADPLLLVRRILYSFDTVVEFRKTIVRSDRCKYTTIIPLS